ncbi:hypothetical protein [Nonomuraea longicatena]|uniref:Uncharacterized protein n=1 Tax=Nonomuraea longicatena TaxID=83682 RepID=A0ABP4AM09_9ACTN
MTRAPRREDGAPSADAAADTVVGAAADTVADGRAVRLAGRMVELLARREAAVGFLPTPPVPAPTTFGGPEPGVAVEIVPCPWCPAGLPDALADPAGRAGLPSPLADPAGRPPRPAGSPPQAGGRRRGLPPAGAARLVAAEAADPALPVLTILGCESIEPRALLPIVLAASEGPVMARFATRAAWLAARVEERSPGPLSGAGPRERARSLWRLNVAESWIDPLLKEEHRPETSDPADVLLGARRSGGSPASAGRMGSPGLPAAVLKVVMTPGAVLPIPAATRARADLVPETARADLVPEMVRTAALLTPGFLGPHSTGDPMAGCYRGTRERAAARLL